MSSNGVPKRIRRGTCSAGKSSRQYSGSGGQQDEQPDIVLKAVEDGKIDAVVMGRAALADP